MNEDVKRHKCFISFKMEDIDYKKYLVENFKDQMIDKSLTHSINSVDEDYILQKIREEHLRDSTVTIFLIGTHSSENQPQEDKYYIKRELRASLYNGKGNTRNGILGIVLPSMVDRVYGQTYLCSTCHNNHMTVYMNDDNVIKEFWKNYFIENPSGKCCWNEDDRYCVLVKWNDFLESPQKYIDMAFLKRDMPIAEKVVVRP